ncbi:glycosyltransferase [Streptomyces kaniharaensis]|uniref:Glycosyltransferase n=1 Tax=Streptomyces kaniharaensis TaxID=212423 RepID=A0A6N7KNS3_9ACTN|nr:glycosyltransferase [Streptomyces kaniharaensis]
MASRNLGTAQYSGLAALLAVLAAMGVALAAVQTVLAASVVRHTERAEAVDPLPLLRRAVALAALVALFLAPAAWPLARALHFDGPLPVLLVDLFLVPSTACVVLWAQTYGVRGLPGVGVPVAAGGLVRLAAGVSALWNGGGICGVVAATVLGESVTAVLLLAGLRRIGQGPRLHTGAVLRLPPRAAVAGVATFAGLWALTGIDVVCARTWLPADQAGSYCAAALLAKATLFAANLIVLFLLRKMASGDDRAAGRALGSGLAAAALAGTAVTGLLALGGRTVVPLVFGPGYRIEPLLGLLLGICAALLLALTVLLHYHATNGTSVSGGWVGALAFPVLVAVFSRTASGIAAAHGVAAGIAVLCALPGTGTARRREAGAGVAPARTGEQSVLRPPHPLARAADLDVSIVIPYYNPGLAVRHQVADVLRVLDGYGVPYEVVAVADGCTDGSEWLLADLEHPNLRRIGYPVNAGKGAAVRTGFELCRGRWVGFIDADGDLPADLLPMVLDAARDQDADAVIGTKWQQSSTFSPELGIGRWICSHVYRWVTQLLFRLPVTDTQTGLKVFRREALAELLPRCQEDRFVFDLEILALLYRHRYRRIAEVPVRFKPRSCSTVCAAAVFLMVADTVRLSVRLHRPPRPGVVRSRPASGNSYHQTAPADPQSALRPVPDALS